MAEYRKRDDGSIVYGEAAIRHQYPSRKFTIPLPESVANELGYDLITIPPKPTTTTYQDTSRDGEELIDDVWTAKWKVTDMTDEEKIEFDKEFAKTQRQEREFKLELCDWTQLMDSPFTDSKKEEWKTYRQALRDLPTSSGWPRTHTWPTPPST